MQKRPRIYFPISLLLLILVVYSCSTEKNAALNRGFHNMTAHYNGYFNARELIKESLKTFHETNKDDYADILPIFIYPDEKNASTLYPNMQKAIDKTSKVITRHSMPSSEKTKNKKEEWCKWIDDNWLVMGQAHFYKREFEAAIEKFEYIYKTYESEEIKYDAQLWLAKTYIQMGKMQEAFTVLTRLQSDSDDADKEKEGKKDDDNKHSGKKSKHKSPSRKKSASHKKKEEKSVAFPERLKKELAATTADYYLKKKDYENAIPQLEQAIKFTKKKREKSRLVFILAQVYQKRGMNSMAIDQYSRIPKLNPTFEMEFYSRIYRALLFEGGDSKGIRAELMKLLRDEKNKEYFDQIYYALAEVELKEKHTEQGKSYLKKSIAASVNNDRQKGKSYLRLGNLSFDERDYMKAKTYYDSSLTFLPKDYPKYDDIRLKSESLTELVDHLTTIQLQDSLYRLGNLPERKRIEMVEEVIRREKEEEERKRLEEEEKALAAQQGSASNASNNGSWYFYNPQAKSLGFSEFKKVWGTRKLEDNWRRSNKESIAEEGVAVNPDSLAEANSSKDEKRKQDLLDKIPTGPDALAECKKKIQYAQYHAGVLYKNRFNQPDLAVKQFKDLISRFDYGEYVLPANYQLYLIYLGSAESKPYETTILTDYPESEYAQLIRNPDFKKDDEVKRQAETKAYSDAYKLYTEKSYYAVLAMCNKVIENEKDNHFMPQYFFLKAMAYGGLQQTDNLEKALSECAEKFPEHEVGKEASEILDYLRNKKSKENNPLGGGYVYDADLDHYFVLVFPNSMGSIVQAKAAFSDFNTKYFSNKSYTIEAKFLDLDTQVLVVKGLENKKAAMEYFNAFLNENDKMKNYKSSASFVISSKNFAHFFLDKKVDAYLDFFKSNYLK